MGEVVVGKQWEEGEVRMTALSSLETMKTVVLVVLLTMLLLMQKHLLQLMVLVQLHSQQKGQRVPLSQRPHQCCGYHSDQPAACESCCCCVRAAQSVQSLLPSLQLPALTQYHPHRSCCC